jgi:hypothetical protein
MHVDEHPYICTCKKRKLRLREHKVFTKTAEFNLSNDDLGGGITFMTHIHKIAIL